MSTKIPDDRRGQQLEASQPTDSTDAESFDSESVNWADYDVEERIANTANSHRFPDVLYALYWREGLSQADIGARFDIAQQTISYWMDKHEIDVREGGNATYYNPALSGDLAVESADHPRIRVMIDEEDGDGKRQLWVYVHQLIALHNGSSIGELFGDESLVCHHTLPNAVSVNTRQTVEVLTRGEHRAKHRDGDYHTDWAEVVEAEDVNGDDDA